MLSGMVPKKQKKRYGIKREKIKRWRFLFFLLNGFFFKRTPSDVQSRTSPPRPQSGDIISKSHIIALFFLPIITYHEQHNGSGSIPNLWLFNDKRQDFVCKRVYGVFIKCCKCWADQLSGKLSWHRSSSVPSSTVQWPLFCVARV